MPEIRTLPSQSPRQPPYSIDAEQSVLGGMMLDNRALVEVRGILKAEDFYRADHRLIFEALVELEAQRRPFDFVTISDHLRETGRLDDAGGLAYLGELANNTPSAANVMAYAEIVRERALLRGLIAAGGDIAELGYRPDGRELQVLLNEAQRRVMDLHAGAESEGDPVAIGAHVATWHEDYFARQRDEKPPGLQTGFRNLDALLIGLEPGDLMIAAGATGMGKTVFGLTIAEYVAAKVGPVAGYSLEMPTRQWLTRLVASRGRIPIQQLRDPRQADVFRDDAVSDALSTIRRLPFYVSDQAGQSIHQIRSRAQRLQARVKNLKLILIDYIQLVQGDRRSGDSRTNEMDSVSRGLKALAKELEVPVLALAQINNKVVDRDNKRPRLSDLRESGGITQDADIVCLLYRDEYYNRQSPHVGVVEVEVAKQRNGKLDVAELEWQGGYCAMRDYNGPSVSERIADAKAAAAPPEPETPAARPRGFRSRSLMPRHLQQ